jgi:3-hydroxyacyl-CoA dehydrogenase/3a,7a,12a-trihydroxy-5b-cholest-24-enoyl-CoA hydratase
MSPDLKAQVERAIGFEFPPLQFNYTERDVALYALGVGAPADWLDQNELKFVYELSGTGFQALPTFAVLYYSKMIDVLVSGRFGEIEYNPLMLVHGEQYLQTLKPLPVSGQVTCYPKITDIYDKGSGMVVVTDIICKDQAGNTLALNQASMFIRGMGGYGGNRGASGEMTPLPDRAPDVVQDYPLLPQQALIYRLSGDINPLHADPAMAAFAGFDRPILHGLCSFGFAGRAILKHFCNNDPARFQSIKVRFSKHVFPGETLRVEMWKTSPTQVQFQCSVVERNVVVLTQAFAEVADQ